MREGENHCIWLEDLDDRRRELDLRTCFLICWRRFQANFKFFAIKIYKSHPPEIVQPKERKVFRLKANYTMRLSDLGKIQI